MTSDVRRVRHPSIPTALGDDVDLAVNLGGVELPNPILPASGCFASGQEMDRYYDVTELGAVVVKSVTREVREGLPTPRMVETPSGMINAIGLQNPGIDGWLERDLPWLQQRGARVVASIAGNSVADYRELTQRLRRQPGIVALEVNLSCPNVDHRGLVFACSPVASAEVIAAVKREADLPVLAKLTADVTDIVEVARAVVDAGADGLTLINTLLGMTIDPETGRPGVHNTYGGLSGPAIRPVAVRTVHQVHTAMPTVPILGCGGIRDIGDVIQFLRAGASAVSVGTATFVDPFIGPRLIGELAGWLEKRGIKKVSELTGQVEPWT